jgi:hypothetical protein
MAERKSRRKEEKPTPRALARWEDEGGAEPCGPQVPGAPTHCAGKKEGNSARGA